MQLFFFLTFKPLYVTLLILGIPPKTVIQPVMGENRPKNEENVAPLEKGRIRILGLWKTMDNRLIFLLNPIG